MSGSTKSVLIHRSGINEFALDESGFNDADLVSLIRMLAVELQEDRQILDLQGLACLIELQESSCVVELESVLV